MDIEMRAKAGKDSDWRTDLAGLSAEFARIVAALRAEETHVRAQVAS
jgi:hypothetical protein